MNAAIANLTKGDPVKLALGAAIVVGAAYLLGRQFFKDTVGAAAGALGGIASGNNALTADTPYEGKGVLGTLGAGANAVTGGALERFGTWLGGAIYDVFHADDPNTPSKAHILGARSDADGKPSILR